MERGHIQGLPKIFGYPILSQERVKKLLTSNFAATFTGLSGSIGTKAHENLGNISRGRKSGSPENFQGTHV